MGRPGLAPGMYFRLLLMGYFEGLDSERGMAWRAADSLALRSFLRIGLEEAPPDHSTISRTRRLIDVETHREVFTWALGVIAEKGLLQGKTLGIDATTLEANAALRSIVRRDSGESYPEFLTKLAKESGIATPTREEVARLDRKRKKKSSNQDWEHPHDPDARITKMKDSRTHLAHKAEHAVDLETGAVLAVTVQGADQGDTTTLQETFVEAAEQLEAVGKEPAADEQMNAQGLEEVVTDKGYHSGPLLEDLQAIGVRSYIPEPQRGRRHWQGKADEQTAVYGNRRRMRGERGKQLLRRRGEVVERSFAHVYGTGGMRRTHLRGHRNILKRLLLHVAAFNLSLILRREIGAGTPRGLQDRWNNVFFCCWWVWMLLQGLMERSGRQPATSADRFRFSPLQHQTLRAVSKMPFPPRPAREQDGDGTVRVILSVALGHTPPARSAGVDGSHQLYDRGVKHGDGAGSTEAPEVERLMTHIGVGPLTALAFVLILGTPERFPCGASAKIILANQSKLFCVVEFKSIFRGYHSCRITGPFGMKRLR